MKILDFQEIGNDGGNKDSDLIEVFILADYFTVSKTAFSFPLRFDLPTR